MSRDARHLALSQVGVDGQARIAAGTVLIIGVGGIGCAAAPYLASSGVGHVILNDFDTVDDTNLGRQVLYSPEDTGKLKTDVAAEWLRDQNPATCVSTLSDRLDGDALLEVVRRADIVLDGCDNFATRFAINDACVTTGTQLISGAAIRMEGQLAVFGPDYADGPCYRCLYTDSDESLDSCAGNGVLSPVPAVIGTLMAVEALKSLARLAVETGTLTLFDASTSSFDKVRINKRENCAACGVL